MPIDKNEITKEMIAKAMQCETADELIALANSEGIELKSLTRMRSKKWRVLVRAILLIKGRQGTGTQKSGGILKWQKST